MTTYDFSKLLKDAKAGGAWPLGDYDFEVADAMVKKSNSSDNEMIVTKLRCLVGPYAGKHVNNNFVLSADSPTALAIFFRHMTAFGLDESFWMQVGSGDLHPAANALKGRRARITIGHRTWNGALQNDIKAINPITEGASNVLPAAPGVNPPQSTATAPPPPPAPTPAPAPVAAASAAAPASAPPPPPPPPPAPAVSAPVPPVVPTAQHNGAPAGYTQELWDSIPDAAKAAILAAQPATPAPVVQPAAPPPPPPLPV